MLQLLKQPHLISYAGNPVAFTLAITPYRALEQKQDLKIIVRIEVEEDFYSGVFTEAKELLLYPEESGCATVSIQAILKTFLSQFIPPATQAILVALTEQCKRYRISYRLLKGNSLVAGTVNTSSIFYVIRGGMSYQEWHPKKFFTETLVNDKPFLRFAAARENVFKDEEKYLTWISSLDETVIQNIYVRLGYSDGTLSLDTLLQSVTLFAWQQCIIPAGYSQLALDAIADPFKDVVWYEVWVEAVRDIQWREQASSAYCLLDAYSANNGYQAFSTLEQYYTDDNTAVTPAVTKANDILDPDYVAPVINTTACPVPVIRPTAWRVKSSSAYCLNDGAGHLTGQQGWTILELYYTDDNSLVTPLQTKSNVNTDPDYVAPVTNTTACPIGARFGATTFVSGDALNDVEIANFTGLPGTTVTIKLDNVINSNGGSLHVNGSNAYLNNTFVVTLNGSGAGTLNVDIAGVTNSGTIILGHFTIIAVSSGTIGSPSAYQISKVF